MFYLYKNVNNTIKVFSIDNDDIYLNCTVGGVNDAQAWNASGITAGTTYLVEIEYNSTDCTLSIDGVVKVTASPAGGIDFGANIPDTAYVGTRYTNDRIGDAVFSAP